MNPITAEKNRLGFVGIGYMGLPIARRLLEAGFKLTAFDREPGKAEELIRYGGTVARNIAELSYGCDVVLSCLPTDEAVLGTYRGTDGAIANARRGSLVIDMSTVYPETSQELSKLGSQRGIEVLDVTISGSTPAAEKGLLTLFGGGSKEIFRWRRIDLSRCRAKIFLPRAERLRSDDEARRELPVGNWNAGNRRSCHTRREGRS